MSRLTRGYTEYVVDDPLRPERDCCPLNSVTTIYKHQIVFSTRLDWELFLIIFSQCNSKIAIDV